MDFMKQIDVKDIENIAIGQVENREAGTGCTVFIARNGMRAGLSVQGGGPASRESQLLNPLMSAQYIHGIVLAGGSAFGLNAANGAMQLLEERGIGFDVGVTRVPLVCQADLFDLTVGSTSIRPDESMGLEATRLALESPNYRDGNHGVGCGCTVGKIRGMEHCMKSGIGSYAMQIDNLVIGAVVAVNSLGDVFDYRNREMLAGLLGDDRKSLSSTVEFMKRSIDVNENKFVGNTTLSVVMTNAYFEKTQLCKIAQMAHDGYARSIEPVHTSADGDSIFAVSVGDVKADQDLVGTLSAEAVSEAIIAATKNAESAYGYPAYRDINRHISGSHIHRITS